MDKKKIPFEDKEDQKPLFPEIYMDNEKNVQEETQETNLKYSNRMLF